jgi:hypothetical protein
MKKWSEQNGVDRFQTFCIALIMWLVIILGWVMFGVLTGIGLWTLAGFLFWHRPIGLMALWIIGGPFFIFLTSGIEPDTRSYLWTCWRNLKNRRNDFPP